MKNKDNRKNAKDFEMKFKQDVVVKSNEDKQNEELDKYFTDYETYVVRDGLTLGATLANFIKFESPVHIDDVYDFMKNITDRKSTQKFKHEINTLLNWICRDYPINTKNDFCYDRYQDLNSMKVRKRDKPNVKRISPEEIEKSIEYTLKLQFSSSRDGLIKSASKYLGFKSVRVNVKERFNDIIDSMITKNILKEINGNIELN